ncbi:MAG: hypothetical protein Q7T82_10900 [Armatimonadota bacterium]|nr:hypothetical protein [Armatimonadota bacterium]
MKSVRIRSDFTVKLPEEVRGQVLPGESLEVVVSGSNVIYRRASKERQPSLREIIERVRHNPPARPPSSSEVEDIVHKTRRHHK